ncbi:HD domain-containing protein [Bacteriovorax sp. PP10]|uniref:HD domain-containing protein n=1 Tax=Bacteriovorax antarcticus TaxID=3088717 RepID=A0ABU5VV16_9BACT|nr:HD domain-containing protein [Bacteriovorax sp. PP10]MEA9356886.1 HD domain-containing protein [Bacteriovorax sp. PP10]
MNNFEKLFSEKIQNVLGCLDPAHDLAHVTRVVSTAKKLALEENANLEVVIPAAWLHDLVNLPKNHPDRKKASVLAADEALVFLQSVNYSQKYFKEIHHAICAHSFSANIKPETLEAQIVQDADRLDALGAIGLARLFAITTQLGRPFYDFNDPFAQNRPLDDKDFGIDHIYIKLEKISNSMNTKSARVEALRRFKFIEEFLDELKKEI